MKKIAFVILVIGFLILQIQSEEMGFKISQLYRYAMQQRNFQIHEKFAQLDAHCPGVHEKLKQAFISYENCSRHIYDYSLTMCSMGEIYLKKCSEPFIRAIDLCTPEESKGMLDLGIQIIESVLKYFCTSTGETLFELGNSCLWNDLQKRNNDLLKCEEKIKHHAGRFKQKGAIPSEYCHFATAFRSCVETRVGITCKNNKTKHAILGLYDALKAPCADLKI